MQEIDKLRTEIDQIHIELARLFKRRLSLTQKIWEIKKERGMPFIDSSREEQIVHHFDSTTNDPMEQKAIQNFFSGTLKETRLFLEAKLK